MFKIVFMYFVYIIYSTSLDKFYVGTTDNVERRLIEHNSKEYLNSFTCKGVPWHVVFPMCSLFVSLSLLLRICNIVFLSRAHLKPVVVNWASRFTQRRSFDAQVHHHTCI